jgi:hypothetical protein
MRTARENINNTYSFAIEYTKSLTHACTHAVRVVLFSDNAVAGEAAGLAMGLVMLGTASERVSNTLLLELVEPLPHTHTHYLSLSLSHTHTQTVKLTHIMNFLV